MDLTYSTSKIFWFVARPGNLLLVVLVVGTCVAWIRSAKAGRTWLTSISVLLILFMVLPVNAWVARPLEERFPVPDPLPPKIDGILVLGGFSRAPIAKQRGQIAIRESAERIMTAAAFARDHLEARLLIAGADVDEPTLSAWLSAMGVDRGRVTFEGKSRNTFENATFSHRKVRPNPNEVWLLVTSAQHIPRAMGVFRKIGWTLIPYPVDYQTADIGMFRQWPDLAVKLENFGFALKEWIGLAAYYAMDRTDELFPGPQNH